MLVQLINFTPDPERTIALAARLCYSDASISTLEDRLKAAPIDKFLGKILKMGHLSVLEHASFTFGIEGISRATSHQLVRHRLASYSQQSQRYVKSNSPEFVIPHTVASDAAKKKLFISAAKSAWASYKKLLDSGVSAEDARYLLPNAACTKIIVTMNARELGHFFRLRCCERAQWEIREMAVEMLKLAKSKAPLIFADSGPACVAGKCSEGSLTCGKPKEVRARFKSL